MDRMYQCIPRKLFTPYLHAHIFKSSVARDIFQFEIAWVQVSEMECCVFCGTSSTSSVDRFLGSFQQLRGYHFHSKCLIFSTDIRKHADRCGELLDFDVETIENVVHRGRERTCAFCWGKGATIKCHDVDCETTFHLHCSLKSNQTLHLNFDNFQSFCSLHTPQCIFDFEPIVGILNKKSDCCKQINYTHDECIKKYVLEAKSQSKCPFCSNIENFKNQIEANMKLKIPKGIPYYARKQNTQYNLKCSSNSCLCPRGLPFHKPNTDFDLISCKNCGSDAIHKICGKVETKWICSPCDVGSDLQPESFINFTPGGKNRKRKRKLGNVGPNKKMAGSKTNLPVTKPEMPFGKSFKIKLPGLSKTSKIDNRTTTSPTIARPQKRCILF